MGAGAAFIFVYAVKKDYFRDIEDTKFQVFWSDLKSWWIPPRRRSMATTGKAAEKKLEGEGAMSRRTLFTC